MKTILALVLGFCIGAVGLAYLSNESKSNGSRHTGSVAWAEPSGKASSDKPWTAAELQEIAKFYEASADTVEDEALEYERTAASITPLTDTKGFRRSALTIAAQSRWKQASELRTLAAEHRAKAERMYAKERAN